MIKRLAWLLLGLLGAAIMFAAAGLTWAHLAIGRERAPLPERGAVLAAGSSGEHPIRLSWINTASQVMPRSAVLDPSRDPRPGDPYVMSHSSFVLEWPDGRILLVDVGMSPEAAVAFGKPAEALAGAAPMQALASSASRLGADAARVRGVIFTHLHSDHVGGLPEFCAARSAPIRVFMTDAQAERPNYTTRPGLAVIEQAACARIERLAGGPLMPVPDFPGVFVIAAGGHTPGSQLVVARVGHEGASRGYIFTGDIVNNIDGVLLDIPKPFLYRLLIVPEAEDRQAELRAFLRAAGTADGMTLLVSHDQHQLEGSGIPAR